ncbi:hypothetical protein H0176_01805 [Methylorubrum populi]|uniref:hypothetical protein n=1 Tax=Methylorubrum rhodesianum TaxID=29427 RepID=UPI00129CA667|nr:hypothetical protein [Methylorubrum rhodesianum]MBK3404012.1 hypothetical protein [Methylorubrum rhodesianum]MBY0139008.1 hypothetical protein [Methylorubrum populi]
MEGAPVPVPRPAFVYSADDVFRLVRDKFWREHSGNQPQIQLTGLYDDVVRSQKLQDDYSNNVLTPEFSRWWSGLSDIDKIQASKLAVHEKLRPVWDLQIPDEISNIICKMSVE